MSVHLKYKISKSKKRLKRVEKKEIMECNFSSISTSEIISAINHSVEENIYNQYISTVNLATIWKMSHNPNLKKIVKKASFVVCDGKPIFWISKIFKKDLPERITGIDLMTEVIINADAKRHSLYFLGGKNIVINKIIDHYKSKYPGLNIKGFHHGFFKKKEKIIEKVRLLKPNIVFVGMGCPRQEYIIEELINENYVNILIGVGGSFDVIAGYRKRAPLWMQNSGMEWFYRLIQEPHRLWKRYFFCLFLFIINIFKEALQYFKRKTSILLKGSLHTLM